MHLLGAAVGRKGDWRSLEAAATGTVWNYRSSNDNVLRRLCTLAEMGKAAAGQTRFRSSFPRIKDRNASRFVSRHSECISR